MNDLTISGEAPTDLAEGLNAHRAREVAVGVLMGLRGCSVDEATSEISGVAEEMRINERELGCALVGLASGNDASPYHAAVAHRWRHLLALREREKSRVSAKSRQPLRVRYGPENQSVVC